MGSSNDVYYVQHVVGFRLWSSQSFCFPEKRARPRDVGRFAQGHLLSYLARTGLLLSLISPSFFSHTMMSHKGIDRGWLPVECDFRAIRKSLMSSS